MLVCRKDCIALGFQEAGCRPDTRVEARANAHDVDSVKTLHRPGGSGGSEAERVEMKARKTKKTEEFRISLAREQKTRTGEWQNKRTRERGIQYGV